MVIDIDRMRVKKICEKTKCIECIEELENEGKIWINNKGYYRYILMPYFDINLIKDRFEVEYIIKVKEYVKEF